MRKTLAAFLAFPFALALAYVLLRVVERDYRYRALVHRGDELLAEGRSVEASRNYGTAIALRPGEPLAYVKRAEAERRQGNLPQALTDIEKAGALSEDVALVSSRLAEILYESGRFDEAARELEKVLGLVPEDPEVPYRLGLARFRAGRTADAIAALNRSVETGGDFWEAYYLRGAVFLSNRAVEAAENDFRKALELAPEASLPREALIELYLDQNLPEKARPLVDEAIAARPDDPSPYLRLADVQRLSGRTPDAIEAVGRALESNPSLPEAYLRLGELWLEEATSDGDAVAAEKAVAALESAVQMDRSSGAAALALGRAYLALGDEGRGFSELVRASTSTPVPAEAWMILGDLYRARKNPAEAVTSYHAYLNLSGDSLGVLERLGDAYLESGSPERGAEAYSKLAALEPRRVAAVLKAAGAYLSLGDRESAVRICRRGLLLNPENPSLTALLTSLR